MIGVGTALLLRGCKPKGFTPTDRIADIALWYKPSDDTVTVVSGKASQVNDLSGLGRNATQGTAGNRPTYNTTDAAYNGRATLEWPAGPGNIAMISSAWGGGGQAPPMTFYFVGETDNSGSPILFSEATTVYPFAIAGGSLVLLGDAGHSITGTALYPDKKCVFALVLDGATSKLYVNSNGAFALVSGDAGGTNMAQLVLGNGPFGGQSLVNGKCAEFIVTKTADSPSQIKQMFEYFTRFPTGGVADWDTFVMFSGNSITDGSTTTDPSLAFVRLIGDALPADQSFFQDGNPALTTTALKDGHTSLPNQQIARRQIAMLWEITNDIAIAGVNAATGYANVQDWCAVMRGHGYRVAVATCIARGDAGWTAGMEATRLAINASIVANWPTFADALIDLAADPRLQDPNDTDYFFIDKIHPNDGGHAVVAELARPILLSMAA